MGFRLVKNDTNYFFEVFSNNAIYILLLLYDYEEDFDAAVWLCSREAPAPNCHSLLLAYRVCGGKIFVAKFLCPKTRTSVGRVFLISVVCCVGVVCVDV